MVLAHSYSIVLQSSTAMDEVQWNSVGKRFNSCEMMLAETSKMLVDDESMNQGTSSLAIFLEKASEELRVFFREKV